MVLVCFIGNDTASILDTKYTTSMHTHCVYSTNNLFDSFQVLLQPGESNSCFSRLISFFDKRFFVSLFLLVVLAAILLCFC